jgi:hypothetical protein
VTSRRRPASNRRTAITAPGELQWSSLSVVVPRPPVLPHGSDVVRDCNGGSPAAGHADHPGHSNSWIQGPREFVGALPVVFTATEKTFAHQRGKATDNYGLGRFG